MHTAAPSFHHSHCWDKQVQRGKCLTLVLLEQPCPFTVGNAPAWWRLAPFLPTSPGYLIQAKIVFARSQRAWSTSPPLGRSAVCSHCSESPPSCYTAPCHTKQWHHGIPGISSPTAFCPALNLKTPSGDPCNKAEVQRAGKHLGSSNLDFLLVGSSCPAPESSGRCCPCSAVGCVGCSHLSCCCQLLQPHVGWVKAKTNTCHELIMS